MVPPASSSRLLGLQWLESRIIFMCFHPRTDLSNNIFLNILMKKGSHCIDGWNSESCPAQRLASQFKNISFLLQWLVLKIPLTSAKHTSWLEHRVECQTSSQFLPWFIREWLPCAICKFKLCRLLLPSLSSPETQQLTSSICYIMFTSIVKTWHECAFTIKNVGIQQRVSGGSQPKCINSQQRHVSGKKTKWNSYVWIYAFGQGDSI